MPPVKDYWWPCTMLLEGVALEQLTPDELPPRGGAYDVHAFALRPKVAEGLLDGPHILDAAWGGGKGARGENGVQSRKGNCHHRMQVPINAVHTAGTWCREHLIVLLQTTHQHALPNPLVACLYDSPAMER